MRHILKNTQFLKYKQKKQNEEKLEALTSERFQLGKEIKLLLKEWKKKKNREIIKPESICWKCDWRPMMTEKWISRFFVKTPHSSGYVRWNRELLLYRVEKSQNIWQKNISWNQLFSNFFIKTIVFTEFLTNNREREFP